VGLIQFLERRSYSLYFEFEIVPEQVAQKRTRGKLNSAGYPAARQAPSPCICRGTSGMRGRERNTVVDRRALIVGRCGQAGELMLLGPDLESILRARMSKPLFKQYRPQPELLNRAGDTADYTSVDDPTVSRPNRLLEISYQRTIRWSDSELKPPACCIVAPVFLPQPDFHLGWAGASPRSLVIRLRGPACARKQFGRSCLKGNTICLKGNTTRKSLILVAAATLMAGSLRYGRACSVEPGGASASDTRR
jgi:hypothetical protein